MNFSMSRKKTPFQKHREEEEAKKKRAEDETARLYAEFVESFQGNDAPGSKAFVRGGTINPNEKLKTDTEDMIKRRAKLSNDGSDEGNGRRGRGDGGGSVTAREEMAGASYSAGEEQVSLAMELGCRLWWRWAVAVGDEGSSLQWRLGRRSMAEMSSRSNRQVAVEARPLDNGCGVQAATWGENERGGGLLDADAWSGKE